ncbi:MAG TPA: Hpt domain-containing protein, partial [Burkholderiaceae bacterium]
MANDINLDAVLHTFVAEARELLEDMEAALLRVGGEADPRESVNAIFRAAHTIKGSSGLFGLDAIVAFTHVAESVLDEVRDGAVALDEALIALLLACGDYIGRMIDGVEAGATLADPRTDPEGGALLAR